MRLDFRLWRSKRKGEPKLNHYSKDTNRLAKLIYRVVEMDKLPYIYFVFYNDKLSAQMKEITKYKGIQERVNRRKLYQLKKNPTRLPFPRNMRGQLYVTNVIEQEI